MFVIEVMEPMIYFLTLMLPLVTWNF